MSGAVDVRECTGDWNYAPFPANIQVGAALAAGNPTVIALVEADRSAMARG